MRTVDSCFLFNLQRSTIQQYLLNTNRRSSWTETIDNSVSILYSKNLVPLNISHPPFSPEHEKVTHAHMQTYTQTDTQKDTHTDRQTNRQTDKQNKQIERWNKQENIQNK